MTGYFVRVKRDTGKFESADIAELSDAELDRFLAEAEGLTCTLDTPAVPSLPRAKAKEKARAATSPRKAKTLKVDT
jgi:hypothetical protein